MPLLVLLAAVGLLVAEIWVVIQVAGAIGVLATVLLLVATSFLGGWLVKREGRQVWRSFERSVADGRPPARAVGDGVFVLLGGLLMLPPGFVTDGLGLLFLLPPTRWLFRGAVVALARRRVAGAVVGTAGRYGTRLVDVRTTRAPGRAHEVIEGKIER